MRLCVCVCVCRGDTHGFFDLNRRAVKDVAINQRNTAHIERILIQDYLDGLPPLKPRLLHPSPDLGRKNTAQVSFKKACLGVHALLMRKHSGLGTDPVFAQVTFSVLMWSVVGCGLLDYLL